MWYVYYVNSLKRLSTILTVCVCITGVQLGNIAVNYQPIIMLQPII